MTRGRYNQYKGWRIPEGEHSGEKGYLVVDDAYETWVPADIFEKRYQSYERMKFGDALSVMEGGRRVTRKGWNGVGMFIYLVPANRYLPTTHADRLLALSQSDGKVPYGAYFAMKSVDGTVVPWIPSQSDMVSDDWEVEFS